MNAMKHKLMVRLATLSAGGMALQLSGCDGQLRTTFENGVIDLVAALFNAFTTALIQALTANITGA